MPSTINALTGNQNSPSSSWSITYPSGASAGDLFVCCCCYAGVTLSSFPAGWARLSGGSSFGGEITLSFGLLKATGSESGTFTFQPGANVRGSWVIFAMNNWYGILDATASPAYSTAAWWVGGVGTSTTPDAPNPQGAFNNFPPWGADGITTYLYVTGWDSNATLSSYPTGWLANRQTDNCSNSNGTGIATSSQNSKDLGIDPPAYTISASQPWVAGQLALRQSVAQGDAIWFSANQ